MRFIYNIVIRFYRLAVILFSPFNEKARLWHMGRKGFFKEWENFDSKNRKVIWIHCASLGEFEQGRPVIEELKKRDPDIFILLTFFSPSGYEIRKDYKLADAVCYIPVDTCRNARRFLRTFRPCAAVFIKYEFWYHYINELYKSDIPLYLVSANFRPDQVFFRWYGKWFAGMLHKFTHIFVQSNSSLKLLRSIDVERVSVAGDTRFDRVYALAQSSREIPAAAGFSAGAFTIVAGSTWPPDHEILVRYIHETVHPVKMIIAPHEIDENEITKLAAKFNLPVARFSTAKKADLEAARVLIIDNIGMLSSLYSYGSLAYIGGGFGKGIHNVLEACTQSIPVMFGPNYKKFREAMELVREGGAFPVKDFQEFFEKAEELLNNPAALKEAGYTAKYYVEKGTGATGRIVDKILIS